MANVDSKIARILGERDPDQRGLTVGSDPMTWNAEEQDWVALDDDGTDTVE